MLNTAPQQTQRPPLDSTLARFVASPGRRTVPERLSPVLVAGMVGAGELLLLAATGMLTAVLWMGAPEVFANHNYAVAVVATALASVIVADRFCLYATPALRAPLRHLWRVGVAWSSALALLVLGLFLLKIGPVFSRGWLMIWFGGGLGAMLAWRALARSWVRGLATAGRLNRRAVVYGGGEAGAALIERLRSEPDTDVTVCGVFDDRGIGRAHTGIASYPLLGNLDQLVVFCRDNAIDMLILTLPITAEQRLLQVLKKLWVLPVDVRLAAHASTLRFSARTYSHVGSVPMIDLFDRPLADWDRLLKTAFDRVVALLALIALSPLMAAAALAIRLDSRGPIFFRQKRLGFNNELVDVWKFRSMYTDMADASANRLVSRDDPRVTPVGRIIRRTSIDELPQLFNVLGGTLSLVGPRPHALQAKAANRLYHEVVDGYFARHKVKPGITGLAQIRGWRGETDTEEKIRGRVAADLEYIENWSLLMDIYILARTPLSLLKNDNAY